jgi:hypothetical protein
VEAAGFNHSEALGSREPADPTVLLDAGRRLGIEWPTGYLDFMAEIDGGAGWVGRSYVMFWRASELVGRNERFTEFQPGFVAFGSDGGGEAFAFDVRTPGADIVMVPFISIDPDDAVPLAATFPEFLDRLREGHLFR